MRKSLVISGNNHTHTYLEGDGKDEEQDHVHDAEDDHLRSLDAEDEEHDCHQPDPELHEESAQPLANTLHYRGGRLLICKAWKKYL